MIEAARTLTDAGTQVTRTDVIDDGVLVVNKTSGWTSHDVVAKVRTILRGTKIGHAGTLDPAATGVLPILVGRGTRVAEYLFDWDKEYVAVLRLGETTDTQDATGTVLARRPMEGLTDEAIRQATARFEGPLMQIPPMYSALKVGGVPLYKAARAGRTVERRPRPITIYEFDVMNVQGRDVTFRVVCSKGTYVRTLCADIGEALGVGGHLLALGRQRVGPLTLAHAISADDLSARFALGQLAEDLLPLNSVLAGMPAVVVDRSTAARVVHGAPALLSSIVQSQEDPSSLAGRPVRIMDEAGRFLAIGRMPIEVNAGQNVLPLKQLSFRIEKVLVDA